MANYREPDVSRRPGPPVPIARRPGQSLGGRWVARRDPGHFGYHYVQEGTGRVVRRYAGAVVGRDGYSDNEFVTVYTDDAGVEVGRGGLFREGV